LKGIEGAAKITQAETEGVFPGSLEVVFSPSRIRGGLYEIDTRTAGAVTLLLQELVPLALFADGSIDLVLKGGTAVPFSPTIEYFRHIVCFFLKQMDVSVALNTIRHGFYPRGGGKVSISIKPSRLTGIELVNRGTFMKVNAFAVASQKLQKARVAERMIDGFRSVFPDVDAKIEYSSIPSIGCFVSSHAHYSQSKIGADGLGKRGKRAEEVGRETAAALKKEIASGSAIDSWMIDQIIIYLGLASHFSGSHSRIAIDALTAHAETAIWVLDHFLSVRFDIEDGILHATALSSE
jgi:RNA 3'-phosphate cyclase